jgi:hypothetical protein
MWDGVLALDFLRRDCIIKTGRVLASGVPQQILPGSATRYAVYAYGSIAYVTSIYFGDTWQTAPFVYIPMNQMRQTFYSEIYGDMLRRPIWGSVQTTASDNISVITFEYSPKSWEIYQEMYNEFFSKSYTS